MELNTPGWFKRPVVAGVAAAALLAVPTAAQANSANVGAAAAKAPRSSSWSTRAPGYTITLAARQCANYRDIMANRARNNIMESLQDLGKNSVYQAGQPVNPRTEQKNDPRCAPLNGWQFELGSGYTKPGQLSVVTGRPLVTTGDTATVPLLNAQGMPTGKDLAGAYVYHVTSKQYELAQHDSLWVQGGTAKYPQLENRYGHKYGFGALRCAVDNQNGNNVETALFPSGTKNVFCYAYYVNPAPRAGTVTIRKKVIGAGVTQGFIFDSNLSYDPRGTFALQVNKGRPASEDFIRADSASFGGPYTVTEQVPNGWQLQGLTCSNTRHRASAWVINQRRGSVAIKLGAGDHVTCTYVDSPPQGPKLSVWKVTSGGVGGPFTFLVNGPVKHVLTATTKAEEVPVQATDRRGVPTDYVPGNYTITEKLPRPSRAGSWRFVQAYCNGRTQRWPAGGGKGNGNGNPSVRVTLTRDVGQACVFRNQWVPNGRLVLRLETIGGTATGAFLILGPGQTHVTLVKGTTTHDSVPVDVFNRNHLPLGKWLTNSVAPSSNPSQGVWKFKSYTCAKGVSTAPVPQMRVVTLSVKHPSAECTAVYYLVPATPVKPAHVEVIKTASGPSAVRSGPAVVRIDCVSIATGKPLANGEVVLARTATRAALPHELVLREPARCAVRESATGTGSRQNLTASATVNGKALALPGTFVADVPGGPDQYVVTVHNAYRQAVVPCRAANGTQPTKPAC
jgi:hypothetical protein